MCDYSVIAENQRDYKAGEELRVGQLGPYTRGLVSPSQPEVAVCLRDGVTLRLAGLPTEMRKKYDLPAGGDIPATFMTLPHRPEQHRDVFVFENTRTILVNNLPLGLTTFVAEDEVVVEEPVVRSTGSAVSSVA